MKKIFCGIFLILMLSCCGLFYGCGEKYADLSLSISLSYSKNDDATTKQLENGDYRITTSTGVFDDHLDGSYTFYIKEGGRASATLSAVFKNAPKDFNYDVSFSISNEIVSLDSKKEHTSKGVKTNITAFEPGTTIVTVYSNEGGKKASLIFNVVEIASDINFSFNNLGLINIKDSQISLIPEDLITLDPIDSTIVKINYDFGMLIENNFYSFKNLNDANLYYNNYTYTLRVLETNLIFNGSQFENIGVDEDTTYDYFYIQANYANPLGEDLVCYTKINLVNKIEDFELYYGSSNNDINENNKINDVTNLIINIEDLNFVDVILRVKSNKENVKFSYLMDSNLPVYFVENGKTTYCDENKIFDDSLTYDKATYTNYYYKIIALKKTTENDNYKNGEYSLNLTCDYADYTVNEFPLIEKMVVKNDTLIKNFSVNEMAIKNDGNVGYVGEIYINNAEDKMGTEFRISVANPIQIVNSNTAFKIFVYQENNNLSAFDKFSIKYKTSKTREVYEAKSDEIFYKGTTFYIKPKDSTSVQLNETYILKLVAEYPQFVEDSGVTDNRAVALIKLDIKQGIDVFTSFDYKYQGFVYNKETNEYETDDSVQSDVEKITFDQVSNIASSDLNLNIQNEELVSLTLNYSPESASDKNILISTSDSEIVKIKQDKENCKNFKIIPISIGKAEIYITTTNINTVYSIPINVYEPINSFDVNFIYTNKYNGVGTYTKEDNGNIVSEVQVGKEIAISLTSLPLTASQYTIKYSLYKNEVSDNPIGNYVIDYKGESTSSYSTLGNVDFEFYCKTNSFKFKTDVSVGDVYIVEIKLENLDGSSLSRYLRLTSYIPVESINIEKTREIVYNPNTISYNSKKLNESDPTVFGLKIETNKKSGRVATYGFDNYGEIVVVADGNVINKYVVEQSLLKRQNINNDLIVPIQNYKDGQGYYWFKLNEEKFKSFPSAIYIFVQIKEFNEYVSFPPEIIKIYNAERVSNLTTVDSDQIYFKQGITSDKQVSVNVFEESSYNKKLLIKIYDIIEEGDNVFYVDALQNLNVIDSDYVSVEVKETDIGNRYNLIFKSFEAGKSVVVVMPEDKIITQEDYNKWNVKKYVEIGKIEKETYDENYSKLYTFNGGEYSLATEYNAQTKYYIFTTLINDINTLWKNGYLAFYVYVADGEKVEFQISNIEELNEISKTTVSITKKYVLTQDLFFDSSINFVPIGNYYALYNVGDNINNYNYTEGYYYTFNEESNSYDLTTVQSLNNFAFGFNGEFSGKYSYTSLKTGTKIENQYKISGLSFIGDYRYNNTAFGLFSTIGPKGNVKDLEIEYSYYQPSLKEGHIFGGIAGVNYGKINDCQIKYENYSVISSYKVIIGGVAGVNYGNVNNKKSTSIGINGNINFSGSNAYVEFIIGGLVGKNEGVVSGNYNQEISRNEYGEIKYLFNNAGFDSSLNINVKKSTSSLNLEKTNIGGAVGLNSGLIKNIAIQGNIIADDCDNVGGLIGKSITNSKYEISATNSYSIAKVSGYNNVGGAIGYAVGTSERKLNIYNISAENYVQNESLNKTFVVGNENVGGLIGLANYLDISYSYTVSYFENDYEEDTEFGNEENSIKIFDVLANNKVAGFIGNANIVNIAYCAANLAIMSKEESAAAFVGNESNCVANNVFAICNIFSANEEKTSVTGLGCTEVSGFYYYIINDLQNELYVDEVNVFIDEENDCYKVENFDNQENWMSNTNINNGLPIITLDTQPLFATTPITVLACIKGFEYSNNGNYLKYLKHNENSLILYFNYDYLGNFSVSEVQLLNMLQLNEFAHLEVYATTSKTIRLNIDSNNNNVLVINNDGSIKIIGEGKATLTISSKLNTVFNAKINVVVKYGLTNVDIYQDLSLSHKLNDSDISILKNENKTLFAQTEYIRDLENYLDAELKSTSEVGFRFKVKDDEKLETVLKSAGEDLGISDLFKFNGLTWLYDGVNYYIDIASGLNPTITPIIAMGDYKELEIHYYPYIKTKFDVLENVVIIDKFEGKFTLSIIKGATDIIFENNLDYEINMEGNEVVYSTTISQLQTHSFTVTLFTDYELDEIVDNIETKNNDDLLTIVKSDIVTKYKDNQNTLLESISITYTINYKDKMTPITEDLIYNFMFWAASNKDVITYLDFVIVGQEEINQVYGTFYSYLTDFPQQPSKDDTIFNATPGVLSVEVYPYISNYSKMRLYYKSVSSYPVFITQLSYNISGSTGNKLSDYPDSGFITDSNDVLTIEKSSGQDTYLLNNLGTYSYSKIYFFSLLVASDVPDETAYTIYVEFLNRQNTIVETYTFDFTTIALPAVDFKFDESLKGDDGLYYIPINTSNIMTVETINYDGKIDWSINAITNDEDFVLTQNMVDVLLPKLNKNDTYIFDVLKYDYKNPENNVFTEDLIGNKLLLTATIVDNDRTYEYSKEIVVTLFTVKDVIIQNTSQGYMTLPLYTNTALLTSLDVYCDEGVLYNEDNWYNEWYDNNGNKNTDRLYQYITASGYEIEQSFSNYFVQLSNSISKAKFSENNLEMSGVWHYSADNNFGYIQSNHDYNNSAFSVELYNEFFSLYGMQIDINSKMSFKLNLSYYAINKNNKEIAGIPNVLNYDVSTTNKNYKGVYTINKDFILNFIYNSDLINAIPISTENEFLNMKEGLDYRLINDIELKNYTPLSTNISSLDGNNFNIYISSFSYDKDTEQESILGLFKTVEKDTILYNVKVHYTDSVSIYDDKLIPSSVPLSQTLNKAKIVLFGGITGTNKGVLTNCQVSGKVNIQLQVDNVDGTTIASVLNGGLVATNSDTGYITNSKVENFDINCYGLTGGFVGENYGKIISCYFDNSSINNLSSNHTGGFVYLNDGNIYESYVQGRRADTDIDIRNSGDGIKAKGIVGGFVYRSQGEIADCYSNISLSSSTYIAGFVYQDTASSIISRSYSICYKPSSDNTTVAGLFAGANSSNYTQITINGTLNNCYYLKSAGWSDLSWTSSSLTKQASGLDFDDFATHASFTNFDLSLVANKGKYANDEEYLYVDGYVWVILDGRPVIVSTLVDTISRRPYVGKHKIYSELIEFYNDSNVKKQETVKKGNKLTTNYCEEYNNENIIFYTVEDISKLEENNTSIITYYFSDNMEIGDITLTYKLTYKSDLKTVEEKELIEAFCGEDRKILDVITVTQEGNIIEEDDNYRANDTIEIVYDSNFLITNIKYKVLESATYSYEQNEFNVSENVGTRTNPQIIYDYESFVYYTLSNTSGKFFRIIKDIDFNYQFSSTSYVDFQGLLQGNYMNLNNISLSFLNKTESDTLIINRDSFGLFAGIKSSNYNLNTMVSNLNLNVVEVLSNSHKFVGALAGEINGNSSSATKIIINNVKVGGVGNRSAYIQGKNAVGGIAGLVKNNVMLKDISVSVNINATKEIAISDYATMLYNPEDTDRSNISYAGAVVGILDCIKIQDASTQKDFNVNNVSVYGNINIIGGIVGSAFGLVGKNTKVNYINTVVSAGERNYLKGIVYAGGLVGENRGTLISSSVTYGEIDTYSTVKIGESGFVVYDYFRPLNTYLTAIGGLVGFNNDGIISNCISSIDVRSKKALIAGGAIGRNLYGNIVNVIATGSVLGESIIGGFIGTINDATKLTANGYSSDVVYKDSTNRTTIESCVAANNWQLKDYSYYAHLLKVNCVVAGFVGTITVSNASPEYVFSDYEKFIDFKNNCYYTNTVYTSSTGNPELQLKPAYYSSSLDKTTADISKNTIEIFVNNTDEQTLFPYTIREMFYEDSEVGYYTLETKRNVQENAEENSKVHTLKSISSNIEALDIFEKIDMGAIEGSNSEEKFNSLVNKYEVFYYRNGNDYVKASSKEDIENGSGYRKIYVISKTNAGAFRANKTFSVDKGDNFVFPSNNSMNNQSNIFNSIIDSNSIEDLYLNGLKIKLNKTFEYGEWTYNNNSSTYENISEKDINDISDSDIISVTVDALKTSSNGFRLPNNVDITKIKLYFSKIVIQEQAKLIIKNIDITYRANISSTNNSSDFITCVDSITSSNVQRYGINISSKKVIYKDFLNNGYWIMNDEFLLNANYKDSDKYLTNIEQAKTYRWRQFAQDDYDIESGYALIATAEQLAQWAKDVEDNSTLKAKLINDIDLSGKYWEPIGTNSEPFEGELDGKYGEEIHSIKYATVNKNSNDSGNEIEYAGVFGVVKNATIKNIKLIGGDIVGNSAGGLVGKVIGGATIENIINRNNVTSTIHGGGIIGFQDPNDYSELKIINSLNYAIVKHNNVYLSTFNNYYFGGLIGRASKLKFEGNNNYGDIEISNTKTSYATADRKLAIYIGGLIGRVGEEGNINSNYNYGKVNVTSNADRLYVGGVIGATGENYSGEVEKVKNYNNVNVYSVNIFNSGGGKEFSRAYVGGVVGAFNVSSNNLANEADVIFTLNTTSDCVVGVGGIVGAILHGNETSLSISYNSGKVEATATSNKTKLGVGGIAGLVNVVGEYGTTEIETTRKIIDCYNSGEILSNNNATNFVGGIAGVAYKIVSVDEKYFDVCGSTGDKYLTLKNTLNIGKVNITNIGNKQNALGAIIGLAGANSYTQLKEISSSDITNLYLRDSAYSGSELYKGYSECIVDNENVTYIVPDGENGSLGKLASSLKNSEETAIFNANWEQKYSTWYPTLKDNQASSKWADKQEELTQEKGCYIVSSAEELAYLASKINSGNINTENIVIRLTSYIDLSNRYWTPIGTEENPFKGVFDGNNFIIKNLTVNGNFIESNSDGQTYGGLFGICKDSTIKNLGLESIIIEEVDFAGAAVAKADNTNLTYVYTDAGLTEEIYTTSTELNFNISAKEVAGGLVGIANNCIPLEENNFNGGIYFCYNNLGVEITNIFIEGKTSIGGLVGQLKNSLINNSYNNSNGFIKTTDSSQSDNTSSFVVGYVNGDSSLFNTFNLCSQSIIATVKNESSNPKIYEIIENVVRIKSNEFGDIDPVFDNLEDSESIKKSNVWTREYSLNEKDGYPSIRGLGQEWKNVESEAVVSFTLEEINGNENDDVPEGSVEPGVEPKTKFENYLETLSSEITNRIDINLLILDYVNSPIKQTTIKKYYFITSREELAWVATNVNNGGLLTNNCEFILLNNIDLSGKYWIPIGANSAYPFQGVFNFNGYTISGLTIDSTNLSYAGLFGCTRNAGIVNGYLHDAFVKISCDDNKTSIYAGTVVGKAYNTTIQNISITSAVAAYGSSSVFVGGLAGHVSGNLKFEISNIRVNPTIKNLKAKFVDLSLYERYITEAENENNTDFKDKITTESTNIGAFSDGGNIYVGGLAGYISGYDVKTEDKSYLIQTIYNSNNISSANLSNNADVFLGGIVGYAHEQVYMINVKNSGVLKTYTRQDDFIGGIVGYMNAGSIEHAEFNNYIECSQDFSNHSISYVGGIVAYIRSGGSVLACLNDGLINTNDQYDDNAAIGGIIGYSEDRIVNVSNDNYWVVTERSGFNIDVENKLGFIGFYILGSLEEVFVSSQKLDVNLFNTIEGKAFSYWSNDGLKATAVRLIGGETSFAYKEGDSSEAVTVGLSVGSGVLAYNFDNINLSSSSGTFAEGSEIYVSIGSVLSSHVITPKLFKLLISTSENVLNLKNTLDNGGSGYYNDPIVCFISYITNN